MPVPTYQQNKNCVKRWRESHREHHLSLQRKYVKKRYHWKKIQTVFLAILLD